jgi:phosphoadenosine phosphosulfate reductase
MHACSHAPRYARRSEANVESVVALIASTPYSAQLAGPLAGITANVSNAIELYARENRGFDGRVEAALARLRESARRYAGRIVQATSLGAEDQVITDLIARHGLPIAIATLDTGKLRAETLETLATTERHHDLAIERHRPDGDAVIRFVRRHGDEAMYRSVDLRKACCALRKTAPLERLLKGRDAWVTGLRQEQSTDRGSVEEEAIDERGRAKINPLATWSWSDVWHYMDVHAVPYNALHDRFFPSIGCAPCTRAVSLGEDPRAGRWWWEQGVKECGLHSDRLANAAETPA